MASDPLDIPPFLKLTANQRSASWLKHKARGGITPTWVDPIEQRQAERRKAIEDYVQAKKNAHNAKLIEDTKDRHPPPRPGSGKVWDRKLKAWRKRRTRADKGKKHK